MWRKLFAGMALVLLMSPATRGDVVAMGWSTSDVLARFDEETGEPLGVWNLPGPSRGLAVSPEGSVYASGFEYGLCRVDTTGQNETTILSNDYSFIRAYSIHVGASGYAYAGRSYVPGIYPFDASTWRASSVWSWTPPDRTWIVGIADILEVEQVVYARWRERRYNAGGVVAIDTRTGVMGDFISSGLDDSLNPGMALGPDDKLYVTTENEIRAYDLTTGQYEIFTQLEDKSTVDEIIYNPRNSLWYAATYDEKGNSIVRIDPETGQVVDTLVSGIDIHHMALVEIPEPASMAMLALGGLVMLKRKPKA